MVKSSDFKQAVILAGGLGTRLRPITNTIPKPMIQFHGKPFLEYLLEMLKDQGFKKVLLLLGYLPEKVVEYFEDGKKWGIEISYSISDVEDDTGLRIQKAKHLIDQYFMLLYCDNYWPIQFEKMFYKFSNSAVDALITVYNNGDLYTKSNLRISEDDYIEVYDKTRQTENLKGVDIGFYLLNKKVLDLIPSGNHNFEKSVLPILIKDKKIITFRTDHRYYSVGSHERLVLTEKFLSNEKTILLDRDGVINKKATKANYITKWDEWEWIEGSIKAISILKKNNYRIIVITNQAGIARGKMTIEDLNEIHYRMNLELEVYGGLIDKIYYCPHGWDENCDCRKPKPGMIFKAQQEWNLNLSNTYFVGDDERDLIAGEQANVKTFQVNEKYKLIDFVKNTLLLSS
jgi:D-glycero-D-manno-heptose 1,7-bisphosphate phosphatase